MPGTNLSTPTSKRPVDREWIIISSDDTIQTRRGASVTQVAALVKTESGPGVEILAVIAKAKVVNCEERLPALTLTLNVPFSILKGSQNGKAGGRRRAKISNPPNFACVRSWWPSAAKPHAFWKNPTRASGGKPRGI